MDFFAEQDRARRRTGLLVFYFIVAVILIVAAINLAVAFGLAMSERQERSDHRQAYQVEREFTPFVFRADKIAWCTGLTLAVIACGTIYRWLSLRSGGRAVAELAGGTAVPSNTTDAGQRRLLNIVEEMSIASGVPMPAVYVLEQEQAINAFAAGFTPSDAAIAVTRGTLERLNRDELQGVVAHEFSHILNGDMRLNIRLIGVLFGILMIAMIGRGLLHSLRFTGGSRRSDKNSGGIVIAIALIGVALFVIGYVGFFFGRLIQAAVSRQREFLADAAAVQFTRNPAGIGGALKKIGGLALGSNIVTEQATQIRHFFFAQAFDGGMLDALSTHPSLADRIRAIEPRWDGKFLEPPAVPMSAAYVDRGPRPDRAPPPLPRGVQTAVLLAAVGSPTSAHLQRARHILSDLPAPLVAAVREPSQVLFVIFGLLSDASDAVRAKQLETIRVRHGAPFAAAFAAFLPQMAGLNSNLRLPLLNLALTALRALPAAEVAGAVQTATDLINADGEVTLFEFMVQKALDRHVVAPVRGGNRGVINYYSFAAVRAEVEVLLSALSRAGAHDAHSAALAFSTAALRVPPLQGQLVLLPADRCGLEAVSNALAKLVESAPAMRKILLAAGADAVAADGVIETDEAELLRAVADALDCPLPPMVAGVEAA